MEINSNYLVSVKNQFLYNKTIGEKAMNQIDENQLFICLNQDINSIATIVKHLSGNMLSRCTDFLTTDGEKEWRNSDKKFEEFITTKQDLFLIWDKGWNCFFNALNSILPDQLSTIMYIRNEGHTVLKAIDRQLIHYPYHVGQNIFYAKMLKTTDWESLSIPKNQSNNYNDNKFSKEKSIKNFTDDELKKLK